MTVEELRALILRASPDPELARGVVTCAPGEPLDARIPFSSLIVLGVVVALEDRYGVRVTHQALRAASLQGITLTRLAGMVEELRAAQAPARETA